EYVKDEVTKVQEDPSTGCGPFHGQRLHAFVLPQFLQDVVGDGLRLTLRGRRRDDEKVGDRRQVGNGQYIDIECLLVERCGDGNADALLDGILHVRASLYKP